MKSPKNPNRPRGGRPPKPETERLKRRLVVCLTETDYDALRREGIATEFRMRGGTSDVQGVVFAKNGYPFNGSKIDRQFSYSKIDTALERNNRQALAPERQSAPTLTPSFSYLLDDLLRPRFDPDEAEQTQQEQQRRRRGRRR